MCPDRSGHYDTDPVAGDRRYRRVLRAVTRTELNVIGVGLLASGQVFISARETFL